MGAVPLQQCATAAEGSLLHDPQVREAEGQTLLIVTAGAAGSSSCWGWGRPLTLLVPDIKASSCKPCTAVQSVGNLS